MLGLRKASWALLVWNVLMGAWYVAALTTMRGDCATDTYQTACQVGSAIGGILGMLVLGGIWLFGYLAFAFAWFMTRPYTYA